MRRVRVFGSTLGALVLASACASSTGNVAGSRYSTSPSPQPVARQSAAVLDSIRAQAIADTQGPGVSIHAEFETVGGSRRARAVFHLDDDAYVVVGHIDPDGIVRIVFPNDPVDDGFAKGQRTYQTAQFFAGFNDQIRDRFSTNRMFRTTSAAQDSYDGGVGYVFIIAAWRPMRFDAFKDGTNWYSYELASADYMRDPRPAIQELASLLAGDAREAYTLKFARYYDTQTTYASNGYGGGYGALGLDYCAGYEPLGFASPFFGGGFSVFNQFGQYGYNFSRRGTNYYYDRLGDCYRTGSAYGGYGYGYGGGYIAQTPPGQPVTSRPRTFNIEAHRPPVVPTVTVGHTMPLPESNKPALPEQAVHTSPTYRQRGLVTAEEPSTGPARRTPQIEARTPEERTRPTLQQMIDRRTDPGNGGAPTPTYRGRVQADPGSSASEPRNTYQRPEPSQNPRIEQPARQSPRVEQPARSEPTPRMQAPERSAPPPRAEPPAVRSAPPPSPPPSAPPPSSPPPSSSSSGPPVKPPPK